MKQLYDLRKNKLEMVLLDNGWDYLQPEGAFYFFIRCNSPSDEFAMKLLEDKKIAVVPGIAYGKHCDSFFRISFSVDNKSFQIFLNWLKEKKLWVLN